jgi:tetratricopeptide (TPR) repeat protein
MRNIAFFATAMSISACAGLMPEIRQLPPQTTAEVSPFDNAYRAGKIHLAADRVGLALVMFQQALAIDPLSVAALNALGAAYDELHRRDLAARYYAKALAIEPNSAETLNNMAISAAMAGEQEKARTLIGRALALDPANDVIRQNAGMVRATREPILPGDAAVENRPSLERTGLFEITLTIPPSING